MALDVKVKIDLTKPISGIGLGIPLILEENATADIDYIQCKSLAEVITAGFADTTKVYKAANAILCKTIHLKKSQCVQQQSQQKLGLMMLLMFLKIGDNL